MTKIADKGLVQRACERANGKAKASVLLRPTGGEILQVVDEKEEDEMREGGSDRLMRTNGTTVPGALAQGSLRERSRYI